MLQPIGDGLVVKSATGGDLVVKTLESRTLQLGMPAAQVEDALGEACIGFPLIAKPRSS